jgi:hypothetical protein
MSATIVGSTVRPPAGPWTPAVHAWLRHFEAVAFDGAPRGGVPVALIDWDLARPGNRADDVAMAASWWAPLRPDEDSVRWGFPLEGRGERLRRIYDGYGLEQRTDLVERALALRRPQLQGDEPRAERARRHIAWLEEHRTELEAWL